MGDKQLNGEQFKLFLERFRAFLDDVEARKKRGQNDFNPLLCVQKQDDEVNMHSGFLYALLNPHGTHYQDDLFLKLFIESIGLKEWFGDTRAAKVYKEYEHIDIYITNGKRHIILENKVQSGDQEGQIAKYIQTLIDKGAAYEDISVLYLTPFGHTPNECSLTYEGKTWNIDDKYLACDKHKVQFKAISYSDEILKWLESCLKEVGAISNLRAAIECYADVVKRVTGKRKSSMDMKDFFGKNGDGELLSVALKAIGHKHKIVRAYFEDMREKLEKIYKDYDIIVSDESEEIFISKKDFSDIYCILVSCFYDLQENQMRLGVCLANSYKNTDEIRKELKKLLGADDSKWHKSNFYINSKESFLHLQELEYIELDKFEMNDFVRFIDKHIKQVDMWNEKILKDLDDEASKLRTLLGNNE